MVQLTAAGAKFMVKQFHFIHRQHCARCGEIIKNGRAVHSVPQTLFRQLDKNVAQSSGGTTM
jgi:hypothetical protein